MSSLSLRKDIIFECPEGEAEFYSDAQEMLDKHKINNIPLNKLWEDIEILSM